MDKKQHWENRYQDTTAEKLTWYQQRPDISLDWIQSHIDSEQALIDIGAGASTLVDHLLAAGYRDISLLDLAAEALAESRRRLAGAANEVHWLVADITRWQPPRRYALWHDRAVFHFLVEGSDRRAYVQTLKQALEPGGYLIMATFAPGGPKKCSGLPIVQYDSDKLLAELGSGFELLQETREQHTTPTGNTQLFNWCLFRQT